MVARLRSHGISAEVPDRHTIGMAPHLSPVLGGVRVQVADVDFDRAQAILQKPVLAIIDEQTPNELREYEPSPAGQKKSVRRLQILFAGGWLLFIGVGLYFLIKTFFV